MKSFQEKIGLLQMLDYYVKNKIITREVYQDIIKRTDFLNHYLIDRR